MSVGYIYIRTNEYWDSYNACKLGKTCNIPNREQTYITSEIRKGSFTIVVEVEETKQDDIERQLQDEFKRLGLHIYFNAGTEFFDKQIITLIIPYLEENNILHRLLSVSEVEELERPPNTQRTYEPRSYQREIIEISRQHFQKHDKGVLVIPCGVGKTLLSLWITQMISAKKILIGVPNILLVEQWQNTIRHIFPDSPHLLIYGSITSDDINSFLMKNQMECILITTYDSCYKLVTSCEHVEFEFDMKINDECHHLTTFDYEDAKIKQSFIHMLDIPSSKQLSLTATTKTSDEDDINVVSNNHEKHFGKTIVNKSLLWAIENKIVCDYKVQTICTDEEQFDACMEAFHLTNETDKRLMLSAFMALKSISLGHSHHVLIYCNNQENANKVVEFTRALISHNYFDDCVFSSVYHSNSKDKEGILQQFKSSNKGLIGCVHCLGEGWDLPLLDGVVFAENMISNIRIVQCALRPCRINKEEPNKVAKLILPVLYKDDWLDEKKTTDLDKVKKIIQRMGTEDESISEKVKVYKMNPTSSNKKQKDAECSDEVGIFDEEMTKNLRLKTISRMQMGMSYEKTKKIIQSKQIQSREDYYKLCDTDARLTREPETIFKSVFTNWIDFLGIDRSMYYDVETCKHKIKEYNVSYPEYFSSGLDISTMCNKLRKIDTLIPSEDIWIDMYSIPIYECFPVSRKKKQSIEL